MRTVADIHDDAAWAISAGGAGAPWPGAMASYDLASQSGVMGRIRWVIDEDFLYGYRSHEIIQGAAADADDDDYLGQPLAIFAIEGHVDVRREYSAVTGEPTNVLSETMDRRWYDRQFIRVDWSRNLVTFGMFGASLELDELFMSFEREPVDNFVQEGGGANVPASWRPQFVTIGEDEDYRFAEEWPADMADTIHYMSFVTNELWTPTRCGSATCESSIRISLRNSFLRIPPNHEYAVETLPNLEYDRFGIIRTDSRTYIAGGRDRSTVGRYCDARCVATCQFDEDCGAGGSCTLGPDGLSGTCGNGMLEDIDDCGAGIMCNYGTGMCEGDVDADCTHAACNLDTHMCEGGLTPERGETDFKTFNRLRHNFYARSLAPVDDPRHTNGECLANWQCDNRHGTAGDMDPLMTDGSVCDSVASRCTIPLAQRPVRAVDYHLSPGYPQHLVRSAFEVIAEWNDTFMRGNREVHGDALPTGERMACQGTDPTQYCYCGDTATAPEVGADNTCEHRSNYFLAPGERGETNPFDCRVALVDGDVISNESAAMNPANPTSFDDYPDDVYRYEFVGEECMLRLNVNSCDVPVGEGELPAACEELGDIRYQFFNFATGAGAGWCGVMQQVQDPLSGEAIAIPINMGGLCLDRISTNAVDLWPLLRGEIDEDAFFRGEHIRGYYERLGDVHVPVGYAPGIDGAEYNPEEPSRPAMPTDLNGHLNEMFEHMSPRFENLASGNEGRHQIHSDRLRLLEGTAMERRLVEGPAMEGATAVASQRPIDALGLENAGLLGDHPSGEALLQQASPFRDSFRDVVTSETMREQTLANNYIYYPREALFTNRYNQWWANAFAGRSLEEAQIRWRQAFHKAVMLHELGHGLGLEHNFAGQLRPRPLLRRLLQPRHADRRLGGSPLRAADARGVRLWQRRPLPRRRGLHRAGRGRARHDPDRRRGQRVGGGPP